MGAGVKVGIFLNDREMTLVEEAENELVEKPRRYYERRNQ
jgi:hypothetical protein